MRLLIIDDNPADVNIIKEIFDDIKGCVYTSHTIENGAEAIKYILKLKPYENSPTPHLIILDLNLPGKNGHEILKELRDKDVNIPIIVYTTSDRQDDIKKAYKLYANCYVVKPPDFNQLDYVLRTLGQFWLNVNKTQD